MVKIKAKKLSLIISIALILALSFSVLVSAENFATITEVEGSITREDHNPPEAIMDGDYFTRWGSMQPWDDVVITLSQPETITRIDIMWFRGAERMYHFELESSTDGTNWTAVAMDKDVGVMDFDLQPEDFPDVTVTGYWDDFPLTYPVTAQYWRLTYLGRYETGVLEAAVGSMWNIRFVIGEAPADEPEPPAEEPAQEEPAQEEPPAAEPAPAQPVTPAAAPQTFDPITLIAIGAIASATGIVVIKKRK